MTIHTSQKWQKYTLKRTANLAGYSILDIGHSNVQCPISNIRLTSRSYHRTFYELNMSRSTLVVFWTGIHSSPADPPYKGILMLGVCIFFLLACWTVEWVTGNLRCNDAHITSVEYKRHAISEPYCRLSIICILVKTLPYHNLSVMAVQTSGDSNASSTSCSSLW